MVGSLADHDDVLQEERKIHGGYLLATRHEAGPKTDVHQYLMSIFEFKFFQQKKKIMVSACFDVFLLFFYTNMLNTWQVKIVSPKKKRPETDS